MTLTMLEMMSVRLIWASFGNQKSVPVFSKELQQDNSIAQQVNMAFRLLISL